MSNIAEKLSLIKKDDLIQQLSKETGIVSEAARYADDLSDAGTPEHCSRAVSRIELLGNQVIEEVSLFQSESLEQASFSVGQANWNHLYDLLDRLQHEITGKETFGWWRRLMHWLFIMPSDSVTIAAEESMDELMRSLHIVRDEYQRMCRLSLVLDSRLSALLELSIRLSRTIALGVLIGERLIDAQKSRQDQSLFIYDELLPALLFRLEGLAIQRLIIQQAEAGLELSKANYEQMAESIGFSMDAIVKVLIPLIALRDRKQQLSQSLDQIAKQIGISKEKMEEMAANISTKGVRGAIGDALEVMSSLKSEELDTMRSQLRKIDLLFEEMKGT